MQGPTEARAKPIVWAVVLRGQEHRVGLGGLLVGRAEEAQVRIVDPLVSRRHAFVRLEGARLVIEDLGSRDGVRVNGRRIDGPTPLSHRDRIAICAHEIVVIDADRMRRERAPTDSHRAIARASEPEKRPDGERTAQSSLVDLVLASAEDALAQGDQAGCAFKLGRTLETLDASERDGGGADPSVVRRFAVCALRAAAQFGRPEWIDAVTALHLLRPRVMQAATLDALDAALMRNPTYDPTRLRGYLRRLDARAKDLAPYERFCLEGLREQLSLPPR